MSVPDASYLRAQRQYDAQLPDCGGDLDECPTCAGEGTINDCGNHECDRCNGSGQIDLEAEKAARREAYFEDKADSERDLRTGK